jgi:putative FmdB family regulatory protein
MPIYEYICQDCQQEFDALRSMSQADLPMACSKCGGEKIKRKISNFFAESGGKAVAGMTEHSCDSCGGGSCAHCGH